MYHFYQKKYKSIQVKTKYDGCQKNAFLFSPLMLLTETCSHKAASVRLIFPNRKVFPFVTVWPSLVRHFMYILFICTYHINEKYWNPGR